MNFSGNITQIMVVVFVALLVFGPKKMMEYAYRAGQLMSQLRGMYEQTMSQVQAEMNEAGIGDAAKLMNSRVDIASEAQNYLNLRNNDAQSVNTSAVTDAVPVTPENVSAVNTDTLSTDTLTATPPAAPVADTATPADAPPSESGRYNEWLPS